MRFKNFVFIDLIEEERTCCSTYSCFRGSILIRALSPDWEWNPQPRPMGTTQSAELPGQGPVWRFVTGLDGFCPCSPVSPRTHAAATRVTRRGLGLWGVQADTCPLTRAASPALPGEGRESAVCTGREVQWSGAQHWGLQKPVRQATPCSKQGHLPPLKAGTCAVQRSAFCPGCVQSIRGPGQQEAQAQPVSNPEPL